MFAQIGIVASITIYTAFYLVGIKRGTVKPVLATWMFFAIATALSFITNYAESGAEGIAANFFNMIDTIATITLFIVILFCKDVRHVFSKFEKICLGAVILIFIGWLLSEQNVIAHLCIQLIMVVAYLPTIVHLWNARKNTESLGMWSFDCLGSWFGIIEPIKSGAFLPLIYVIRSIVSTFAVVVLILRIKYRARKTSLATA